MTAHTPGKVAIVEIVTPERAVKLIEVALNGETLTITGDQYDANEEIKRLATALIASVKELHHG